MKRVHCLGIVVVDALCSPIHQYPVPKKTTQVTAESLRFLPGGGAANSAAALGQMGVPATVFSKVGKDPNGAFVIESLRSNNVDPGGIVISSADSTPFTFVGIHPDGDRTFIHTPGANKFFCVEDLNLDHLLSADFLLYPDLWALPSLDGAPVAGVLAEAKKRGVVTLLDECWGFGPNRTSWEQALLYADYVLPSLDDMNAIYPGLTPEGIVEYLHGLGTPNVLLKMGKEGCLASFKGEAHKVSSLATEIVDTTGAGDCFNAGFIAGLAYGLSEVQSASLGSLAAAYCIKNVGGASGIPKLEEMLQEVSSFKFRVSS